MELNSNINTFAKGLDMDTDITMLQDGQYCYAENIRLLTNANGTTGTLQNIEHIRQYNNSIPSDETILGTATTRVYDKDTKGTIECGIVLTKKYLSNGNVYNTLYKVTDFDSINIKSTPVVKGYLELENNVSIVTNYESDLVSNVYISDGLTPIKLINIYDTFDEISDPTRFDITPGCVLLPFELVTTVNGALPAGSIQYCYQLFNMNGAETTTAALSEVIPLTEYDSAGESIKVKGQLKGTISGRGCQIKASFMNDGRFDRARIFSIVYLDNLAVPDIYIINEIEIPSTKSYEFIEFNYTDTGASFLSKITIDEFNNLVPFEFNAKSIEKMSNRLFASNVQELTWDVKNEDGTEFDTRAYRCNASKYVVLDSSDSNQKITGYLSKSGKIFSTLTEANADTGTEIIVSEEHDCINMSNADVLNSPTYVYGYDSTGNLIRGGSGPNISYRFTYTELVQSDTVVTTEKTFAKDLNINASRNVYTIYTFYEDGTICNTHTVPTGNRALIPNYADPYICANYLGYQRDEIYRFGIIFYNRKNIPSPVHWIGDIRMPGTDDVDNVDSMIHPFHTGHIAKCRYDTINELVSYALGIEFTVKNIPSDVLSYEIVRCDRNEANRTVVTQGILSALQSFDDWGEDENQIGDNDVRPAPFFNMMSVFPTRYNHEFLGDLRDSHTAVPGYFEFVSPEIVISKDTIIKNISNNVLHTLYTVNSVAGSKIVIPQSRIYNVAENELVDNDTLFGQLYTENGEKIYLNMGTGYGYDGDGFAGVFKYYNYERNSSVEKQNLKIEDAIVGNTLPYIVSISETKNYVQLIGNKAYVNTSIGGVRQYSNHGINAILQVDELFKPYSTPTTLKGFCTAIIANIKQNTIPYGGNTYISRQNSIYQSCSSYMACDSNYVSDYHKVLCYGGDTYLGVLDYLNTSVIQQSNKVTSNKESRLCCVCYIPLESQVNLNLRSDESYSRGVSGMTGPNLVQNEPTMLPNGYAQKTPYYEYNPVYSSVSGSKQYVPKGIYSIDDKINQNRIVVSEVKTNGEITDSWTKFKFANYLDVDSQYGQITNLKTFNNKLYFWQDNAVGIASVNERSLITDNNIAELTLGTGGILTRFDYVATLNGSSIVNDKSIVNSSSTIYWYDFDKNEICAMNSQGLQPLSKYKSVQSYLNTLPKSAKDNAVSFYDKKYNEVWFRIYDKSLIYNEQLQVFTSFYTHDPNWFFPFSDKLVTIKDNNMYYLHNIYEVNSDLKEERISKIKFVVNKDVSNTKVFDNVMFSADLLDNHHQIPNIVTNVAFDTKTQHTNLTTNESFKDIEVREDNYRFAIPREKVDNDAVHQLNSQSYLGRMRGKYLICDYTFDCNDNREFKIPYIKTTYRYSML